MTWDQMPVEDDLWGPGADGWGPIEDWAATSAGDPELTIVR